MTTHLSSINACFTSFTAAGTLADMHKCLKKRYSITMKSDNQKTSINNKCLIDIKKNLSLGTNVDLIPGGLPSIISIVVYNWVSLSHLGWQEQTTIYHANLPKILLPFYTSPKTFDKNNYIIR